MKRLMAAVWLASSLAAGRPGRKPYKPNDMGVTMGHWHLNSVDVEANKKIFAAMGGNAVKAGDFGRVRSPASWWNVHLRAPAPPSAGGTDGTVVNHVGFIVQNVQDSVAKWKAAGVAGESRKQHSARPGLGRHAGRLAGRDSRGQEPERSDQARARSPLSAGRGARQEPGVVCQNVRRKAGCATRRRSPTYRASRCGSNKVDKPLIPTKGRILDHIGFDVVNIEGFVKKLEADGIKLDRPITRNPNGSALGSSPTPGVPISS